MNLLLYVDPQDAVFVLIGILLICLFVSAIFYFKAKHNEKMLLIEKGLTGTHLPKRNTNSLLKTGIVIIGISIGLVINSFIDDFTGDAALIAVVGICGGLSMIIANRLDKKD